jgi:hypothetical protein
MRDYDRVDGPIEDASRDYDPTRAALRAIIARLLRRERGKRPDIESR